MIFLLETAPILMQLAYLGIVIITTILLYLIAKKYLDNKAKEEASRNEGTDSPLVRQSILLSIILIGFIFILVFLPLPAGSREQLFIIVGIVLSGTLGLASTTFLGNAMAGIMNKAMNKFDVGDFIQVNEHFGSICERGLFHVEIQGEDMDLTTLPNLYLANNPVKVMQRTGTIISASVSLGYDVSRKKIEDCLIEAAKRAKLKDPYVFVTELGDFSVVYKVHGELELEKKKKTELLIARSNLYKMMLDELHKSKIEIVSPTFMNQRRVEKNELFIPQMQYNKQEEDTTVVPEVFGKAETKEKIKEDEKRLNVIDNKVEELKKQLEGEADEQASSRMEGKLELLAELKDRIQERITEEEKKIEKKG